MMKEIWNLEIDYKLIMKIIAFNFTSGVGWAMEVICLRAQNLF